MNLHQLVLTGQKRLSSADRCLPVQESVPTGSVIAGAGLRIQRMPSGPDTEFGNPANYPYMCVASPSCHDTSTTRAWYKEDPDRRQRFYNNVGPSCSSHMFSRARKALFTQERED